MKRRPHDVRKTMYIVLSYGTTVSYDALRTEGKTDLQTALMTSDMSSEHRVATAARVAFSSPRRFPMLQVCQNGTRYGERVDIPDRGGNTECKWSLIRGGCGDKED